MDSLLDKGDQAIDKTFDAVAGDAGVIDAAELVEVFAAGLEAGEGRKEGLNLETCRCLAGLSDIQTEDGLITKKGVMKVWDDLENWRKAFRIIDKDHNKRIDAGELKKLFEIIDFHAGEETVKAIMKRYGGKKGTISEEDFLQSFCKALQQFRMFRELEENRLISMDLNTWLSLAMKI